MEETAPKQTVWDALKAFSPATGLGFVLLVLFLVFCNIDTTAVRWWLMLPLAAAGCALLLWRRKRAAGIEARLCAIGIGLFLALVVLRDIGLSRKLAELLDTVEQYKTEVGQMTSEINRFFGR
ncbi:MAG TPA: hypothetical protein DCM68_06570 [Verrucomicrobia bacterium]|nr:hypothetical protein [Verrucomicrobiota bacterium]